MTAKAQNLQDDIMSKIDIAQDRKIHFIDVIQCFDVAKTSVKASANSIRPSVKKCSDFNKLKVLIAELDSLLERHALFANKAIMIFNGIDKNDTDSLNYVLDKVFHQPSYDLGSPYLGAPYKIYNLNAVKIYTFLTKRTVRYENDVDMSKVTFDTTYDHPTFTALVGIIEKTITCYDAIIVDPLNKRVIVQADMASILKHKKESDVIKSLCGVVNHFDEKSFKLNFRDNSLNVFKCVRNFYDDTKSKGVVELRFFGSDGVSHSAKSPNKKIDIRDTNVHKGGVKEELANAQHIRSYYIIKNVPINSDSPLITIGMDRRLYDASGTLPETKISFLDDCKTFASYFHCIDKIIQAS